MELKPVAATVKTPAERFTGDVYMTPIHTGTRAVTDDRRPRPVHPGRPHQLALPRRRPDPARHRGRRPGRHPRRHRAADPGRRHRRLPARRGALARRRRRHLHVATSPCSRPNPTAATRPPGSNPSPTSTTRPRTSKRSASPPAMAVAQPRLGPCATLHAGRQSTPPRHVSSRSMNHRQKGSALEYTRLGRTGLKVSRIGLGCMSYGNAATGMHQWTLDEDAAAAVLPAGRRARRHVLGHRERLPGRHLRRVRRPGDHPVLPARGHRAGDQGQRQDARRTRRQRPVPQGHPGTGRRVAAAAGHRLHRRVLHPPLRRRDAGRGDHGHAARPGAGGQGALPRRLVDVGLAVREAATRRACCTGGRRSRRCRTSTTCSSAKRSGT